MSATFPSKLLLFGEHTVVSGGQALAIPFPHFHAYWQLTNNNVENLQMDLPILVDYLENLVKNNNIFPSFNAAAFRADLAAGYYLKSSIPTGYGVGSSGALIAAIYARYFSPNTPYSLPDLKVIFGQMESFFHGASSGIDPLICHLQQPLWMRSKTDLQTVQIQDLDQSQLQLFLIDTNIPRKTAPLVDFFQKRAAQSPYTKMVVEQLSPAATACISAYIQGNSTPLWEAFTQISALQIRYFSEMIPSAFHAIWKAGLKGNNYRLKLCGAGGGGFILGIGNDFDVVKEELKQLSLIEC